MNELIKLSVAFVKGEIEVDTYVNKSDAIYLAKPRVRGNFPEAMLFATIEHYNPADDRLEYEYDADEMERQIKQVLEGNHPLYADIDYPVIKL